MKQWIQDKFRDQVLAAARTERNYSEIARKAGTSLQTVIRIVEKAGLVAPKSERYARDEDGFFEVVDSPDKAYCLGLIAADGSINKLVSSISIVLSEKDRQYLSSIADLFGRKVGKPVKQMRRKDGSWIYSVGLHICNSKMARSLARYGIVNAKTKKLTGKLAFKNIPENLWRHFVRGYFDGDGSVTREDFDARVEWCSYRKEMVQGISDALVSQAGVSVCNPKKRRLYVVQWCSKHDIRKIYDYMYPSDTCLCLHRKRHRIEAHLNRFERYESEAIGIKEELESLLVTKSMYQIDRLKGWHLGRTRKMCIRLGLAGKMHKLVDVVANKIECQQNGHFKKCSGGEMARNPCSALNCYWANRRRVLVKNKPDCKDV